MELKIGDIVEYHSFSGTKIIKVSEICDNYKNGAPGIIGEQLSPGFFGTYIWCYRSQIVRKLEKI